MFPAAPARLLDAGYMDFPGSVSATACISVPLPSAPLALQATICSMSLAVKASESAVPAMKPMEQQRTHKVRGQQSQ